jgi:glycosyltransferase involved in cell wall biosynthesis
LSAAARICRQYASAYFVLCGDHLDRDNDELMALIKKFNLDSHVRLLGRRDDVHRIIKALDILVSSSISEGFPNVIGEAMACGIPCAVTDAGDSARMVGETGKVVPIQDPPALAEAILALIKLGPEGRLKLGEKARARIADHYDLTQIIKAYEKFYLAV